jgi:glycosyltransferase involved in cell wall biosynthesis
MDKLKILKVIDVYGWAWHFTAQNQQKYSNHQISYIRERDFSLKELKNIDIVYFHLPWNKNEIIHEIKNKYPNIKVIGSYGGENTEIYGNADLITTNSTKYLDTLNKMYKDIPIIFLPQGVNTDYFIPGTKEIESFIPGWTGSHYPSKRFDILNRLKYTIKKHREHGGLYFIENKTQENVLNFYQSISCFILCSSSEGLSNATLEAMSCGLPVISTDVGSVRLLLSNEWIIPVNPKSSVIKEMNQKLKELEDNSELRKKLGERNREHIIKYFDWKLIQPIWDSVFIYLMENHYDKINDLCKQFLKLISENKEPVLIEKNLSKKIKQPKKKKIKVVQLANIPCANSGFELSKLINEYSENYESRYILFNEYSGGSEIRPFRKFPYDLFWGKDKEKCIKVLKEADIIHIHHDVCWDDEVIDIIKTKPIIITWYNLENSLKCSNKKLNDFNKKWNKKLQNLTQYHTVIDQPLQREMFDYIGNNYVPLIKFLFKEKIIKNNPIPLIVFSPSTKESGTIGTKMYPEVLDIIDQLKKEGYLFNFDLIIGVDYEECMNRKKKADIIIDDVNPTYEKMHNTSIEAACYGAVALTNYSTPEYPFLKTDIYNLKETLIKLITDKKYLKEEQKKLVEWRENNYTPQKLLAPYEKLYGSIINKSIIINPTKIKFMDILKLLNNLSIRFWLLEKSCLEVILNKTNISDKLIIGVKNEEDKNKIIDNISPLYNELLTIYVEPNRQTILRNWNNIQINVPLNPRHYLCRVLNKSWQEMIKICNNSPDEIIIQSKKTELITPKLKLLEVIDEYGESYWFNHLDMKKYSQLFDIDCIRVRDLNPSFDIKKYNIIYFHSPDISYHFSIPPYLLKIIRENNITIVGGYGRESYHTYNYSDLIISLSLSHSPELQKLYPKNKVIWMPKGIDTNYFTSNNFDESHFVVGWAGSISKVKRINLLNKLDYPVLKQEAQHTPDVLIKETTLEPMKTFYKNIDVFILLSKSEASPRVILEAMANGLPVISTDVGSIKLFLESQWLISSDNEGEIVRIANKYLNILQTNPQLRKQVGERNRAWAEKYFNCAVIQPLWDKVLESAYKKDYNTIKETVNNYLIQFKDIVNIKLYLL